VSEEDEASSEEEERSSEEEEEEEIESDEAEEDQKVSKGGEEEEKERSKKHKLNKLQTPRVHRNGKTTGSYAKPKVTNLPTPTLSPIVKEIVKGKKRNRDKTAEDEEEEEEEKKDGQTNKPTFNFGKSMVRDFSQPAKKYSRDKFMLGM